MNFLAASSVDWSGMGLAVSILFHLMGAFFIFAFLMQFNQLTMEIESAKILKKEWKPHGGFKAVLRWYFLTPFKVFAQQYRASRKMIWFIPIGMLLIGVGQLIYHSIKAS